MPISQQQASPFLGLPDIRPDVYEASSSLDVIMRYHNTLSQELVQNPDNSNALFMRNAFRHYHICVSQLGEYHRQLFFNLHKNTEQKHPELFIRTSARIKSVLRFFNKGRRHLSEGSTVYDINDIFAGRITIDSNTLSEAELINLCYEIANESIEFMLEQGYLPLPSSGVKDSTGHFDSETFPDIYVPQKSLLKPEYRHCCKDYIISPKDENGYQSLHIVFINAKGERIELQIRTFIMDDRAENFKAQSHEHYEELQDGQLPKINLDRSMVKMPFYSIRCGVLNDEAGLEKSSPLMLEIHRGGNT